MIDPQARPAPYIKRMALVGLLATARLSLMPA
jgi:hypothetical protein